MAEPVAHLPTPAPALPEVVTVSQRTGNRISPNETRLLKQQTGHTLEELYGEGADEADKMQTLAWLALRRQGFEVDWSACGDMTVEFQAEQPDPTSSEPSRSSPDFADSGA